MRISDNRIGRLWGLRPFESIFFVAAIASLAYAAITAPRGGFDLRLFQQVGRAWIDGSYTIGNNAAPLYPPFAAPIFATLALLPFDYLVLVWLAVNLAAAFLTLRFALELYGPAWPSRVSLYLSALLLTWAPFRVTLRLGQLSLIATALLLGALVARQKKRDLIAGVLLGFSLCKYSLTLPFLLYFAFRKEWKIVALAMTVPVILIEVFALRMGISAIAAVRHYAGTMFEEQVAGSRGWMDAMGTAEIKPLLVSLTAGNDSLALALTVATALAGLIAMALVFRRSPDSEKAHFATLALFALWSAYHRVYDAVICVLPAALLIDLVVRRKLVGFSRFWLGALGLLALSLPGLLTQRLHLSGAELSGNPFGWLGLNVERLLVFGMFWSLLFVMRRKEECFVVPPSGGTDLAEDSG